jgi:hypothetical protein
VADIPQVEADAQQWHDAQVEADPEHEQFSSCWCCCWSCDPDATGDKGNPFYTAAQAGMRAERAASDTGSNSTSEEKRDL